MKKYLLTFLAGFVVGGILIAYLVNGNAFAKTVNGETDDIVIGEKKAGAKVTVDTSIKEKNVPKLIDVPYISQIEEYPNGCEAVSAVMVLRYFGFDINVDRFIDTWLPMGERPQVNGIGPDPEMVYCGDPRSPYGWGCYSSVIAGVFEKMLYKTDYTYIHSYSYTLDELCEKYIDKDIPVILWATVDMADSSDKYAHWVTAEGKDIYYNRKLHCLVLTGYDDNNYYFNDPMVGKNVAYSKEETRRAYEILGTQSIALVKK